MNCAEFERGLACLMGGERSEAEREPLLQRLRGHAAACDECRGSGDLVELLASPAGEREIADDPGETYWSTFEQRLQRRLEGASARSRRRWWAVAAAAVLLSLVATWMLRGPREPAEPAVIADAGTGPTSAEAVQAELPPSLVRSLDRASAAEVEDQLAALDELGPGCGGDESGAAIWGGGLFPEVERLDNETRERLLEWLRDQNRGLEGAQG